MTFPSTEPYIYGTPTTIQNLVISTSIIPAIEITSAPRPVTNSLQATFDIRVYDAGLAMDLPNANLSYKVDGATTYTSLGTGRTVSFAVTAGSHEIFFMAEFNGIYSMAPAQFSWTIDTIRPSVVNIQPIDGTTQVNTSPTMFVEFSENMDPLTTVPALSLTPAAAGAWTNSGNIFTFVLTNALANDQTYTIQVANTATDLAGNTITAIASSQFSTVQEANQPPDPPNFMGLFIPSNTSARNFSVPFNVPLDANNDALHFVAEIATNSTFTSGFLSYNTINNPDMFIYYDANGSKVGTFPGIGVPAGIGRVVFNPRLTLANGQYWVRFFANDRR